jgi:hypothetical protein
MSNFQTEFTLNLTQAESWQACLAAADGPGWRLTRRAATLACMEIPHARLGFTSPVQVEIAVTSVGDESTRVTLRGSNFGLGPIQASHVQRRVEALRLQIKQAASQMAEPSIQQLEWIGQL